MHPIITKTLGGLSGQYYIRQFLFGLVFPAFAYFMASRNPDAIAVSGIIFCMVNTLLYPYSRFVYESIVGFIMGENLFFVNAILMLFVKLTTMAICWSLAIFIAPIGLAYLYYHHSKSNTAG